MKTKLLKKGSALFAVAIFFAMTHSMNAQYCDIADADDVNVEEITAVDFAGTSITNDDTDSVLINKTDTTVDVTAGETYTLVVEGNTHDTDENSFMSNIVAFIDWDQNEVLDDTGEVFELGILEGSTGNDGTSVTMEITVPADAALGETRFRITKTYTDEDSNAEVNPCAIEFDAFGVMIVPGYGQALDFTLNIEEAESGGEDCGQGDDSNNFENAFNITDGVDFRNADDFIVSSDNTLNIQSIEFNILAEEPITSLDINFYNDDNGAPGSTIVETVSAVVPYAQVMIGAAFGYNAYAVFVEVDLDFDEGTYWMQPAAESTAAFWEVSTVGTLGEPIHTSDSGGAWEADEDGAQAVFKLHCDVATPPDAECLFDITSTVEPITRMIMANVDNTSSADSTEPLEDFTDVMIMGEAGESYDVALEGFTGGGFTNYFTIFIDTSDSEDVDWTSYETYEIGSINDSTGEDGQQATSNITLPTDLQEGEYLLRVVKNFNTSPLDPCSTYSFGQGEDYTLVIGELEDCTGTPDAGVASVDPEEGDVNSTYTVSAADYDYANGMTYQWQSNTDGEGWEDEGDLEDNYASYTATAPAEEGIEVEWRLEVTCTPSQETSYSETAIFTTTDEMTYCIPVLNCEDGDMITNVTFQEIDNTTTCSPDGYGDYTDLAAIVQSGGTYPISVSVGDGWANESVSVWIDFDQSGTFDEDEFFYIGTGSDEALTGEILIPEGVTNGDYRMRVRVAAVGEDTATWDMSCDETQPFGETEDYTITVDGIMGIDDNVITDFTYYPNPMDEVLHIQANLDIKSISVYNVLGQEVLGNKHFTDNKVDVSALPTGTFIFRVTFDNGNIKNFKAVKK